MSDLRNLKAQLSGLVLVPPLILPRNTHYNVVHHHAKEFGFKVRTLRTEKGLLVWRVE